MIHLMFYTKLKYRVENHNTTISVCHNCEYKTINMYIL